MQHIQNTTLQKNILMDFVEQNCDYCFSGECLGASVNGNRLKRKSKATVIYQYPYEFPCPNAGQCWLQVGGPCDYFEKSVLPQKGCSAIVEEYARMCRSIKEHKPRFCECGETLAKRERYCGSCRKKRRRRTNRENLRKYRGST